jgi:predicted  nucleic acid-binding Zn-ribbon protein
MNDLMQNLLKLQTLEFTETKTKNTALIADLRGKIPVQIVAHYDRLAARGKKGVAAVTNQVCGGCHMKLPLGVIMTLKHDVDIQLCETCGRYLYLTAETIAPPVVAAKPVRRRKAVVAA